MFMNGFGSWMGSSYFPAQFFPVMILLTIWDLYWKGRGMWQAARNKDTGWFIAILLLNTVGILPILYLYFFQKKTTKRK